MEQTILQLLLKGATDNPHILAVDDGNEQLTYAQLIKRVRLFRAVLEADHITRGDCIAVFSTNNADYVALYFACADLGAVLVPINAHLQQEEISWILQDCRPVAIAVEQEYLKRLAQPCADLSITTRWLLRPVSENVAESSGNNGWQSLRQVIQSIAVESLPELGVDAAEPDSLAVQMYTSGTTGRPKGAMLSHRNMVSIVDAWLQEMPMRSAAGGPVKRFMQATPLFHVGGLLVCFCTLASGASLVLLPKFEPRLALRTLIVQQITHTLLVPAMIQRLLQLSEIDGQEFPHLQLMVYGASPMPESVLRSAQKIFACDFLQGYGLTETAGAALVLRPADHLQPELLRSAGKPIACNEVKVVNSQGVAVVPGEVGEILVRGANVCLGYWQNSSATEQAIRHRWLYTGDLATQDERGYVMVIDRRKDMIDMSGENVYPVEVENVLSAHPCIAEVAVMGLPRTMLKAIPDLLGAPEPEQLFEKEQAFDRKRGLEIKRQMLLDQTVVAIVVVKNSDWQRLVDSPAARTQLATDIVAFSLQRLARFKCPRKIIFSAALPRTPAGKIQKQRLRNHYASCWRDWY